MPLTARIYVAGHRGLVGSALVRCLRAAGYNHIITRTHAELDLIDHDQVRDFFKTEKPEYLFLAAARVGGIVANNSYPAEFIHQNLAIQSNVIHQAWLSGVKRLLFLGSSCIYPRECPQPMKEEYLLTGPLEPTNRPYAVAKIAGIEMCWAYNRQYNTRYLAAMPTNLYGPGDNYDLESSHVIPALIRKLHEARTGNARQAVVWGSGSPRREFLYSDDAADAGIFLMNLPDDGFNSVLSPQSSALEGVHALPPLINIGCGKDQTIRELVNLIKQVVGFDGELVWDTARPDGTPRKLLDVGRMRSLGWQPRVELVDGLGRAYADFLASHV
ncbi:MAG: GDP-L-fucose synthase [Desulfobacterales bacterium]|nr:GDP-L-fucose synthase [Desulfobacterales bacterium]